MAIAKDDKADKKWVRARREKRNENGMAKESLSQNRDRCVCHIAYNVPLIFCSVNWPLFRKYATEYDSLLLLLLLQAEIRNA